MPTPAEVIAVAQSRIGSDGATELAWYGDPMGTPWCNVFESYVLFHAGFTSLPGETTGKGFAYVPAMVGAAKSADIWLPGYFLGGHPAVSPGMGIVYVWNGVDDGGDHTGLVEYVDVQGNIHTIEGNSGTPPLVERHVVGPWGDRPFSTVLGFVAWPLSSGVPIVPTLAPEFNPPINMTNIVARDFNKTGPGMRFLMDNGTVDEFGMTHYGSPAEDPAANWASGGRHGAKLVNNDKGGFDVWDTLGEHYGPYGPH